VIFHSFVGIMKWLWSLPSPNWRNNLAIVIELQCRGGGKDKKVSLWWCSENFCGYPHFLNGDSFPCEEVNIGINLCLYIEVHSLVF
jgi:hypothetical protein